MPSGKTHDAITIVLAGPVFAAGYQLMADPTFAARLTASFLFGGLMFGPDLDTVSKQYSRWLLMKPLWIPYRAAFRHRSRWSHGLVFGTLFRVVYFMGIASIGSYALVIAGLAITGGEAPDLSVFAQAWRTMGTYVRAAFGANFLPVVFLGMWGGAASHTFTDMAGTYIKTGRITEFL